MIGGVLAPPSACRPRAGCVPRGRARERGLLFLDARVRNEASSLCLTSGPPCLTTRHGPPCLTTGLDYRIWQLCLTAFCLTAAFEGTGAACEREAFRQASRLPARVRGSDTNDSRTRQKKPLPLCNNASKHAPAESAPPLRARSCLRMRARICDPYRWAHCAAIQGMNLERLAKR